MTEATDLEKTRPILVLEGRRKALIDWLAEGQAAIAQAEAAINKHKVEAIEMLSEVDEIETALNALHAARKEPMNDD